MPFICFMVKRIINICLVLIFLGFTTQVTIHFFTEDVATVLYDEKEDSNKEVKTSFDDLKYTETDPLLFQGIILSKTRLLNLLSGNAIRGYLQDSEMPPERA